MSRVILPNKYVADQVQYQFDFTSVFPFGETISTASVASAVFSGTDGSPSSMISGAASFSTDRIVRQNIIGGVAGVIYVLTATVTTNNGRTYTLHGYTAVLPSLP